MQTNFSLRVIASVLGCFVLYDLPAQQTPSEPKSEMTYKAGDTFAIGGQLQVAGSVPLQATATYEAPQMKDGGPGGSFSCMGSIPENQITFKLECKPDEKLLGGEYRKTAFFLRRNETGETNEYKDIRFPIVTIEALPQPPPPAPTIFPVIASTVLLPTKSQSLSDGSLKAESILKSLDIHFQTATKDTKENRGFLREQVENAKTVVHLTRQRYGMNLAPGTPSPVFFEDFDRRLDQVIRELGGTPSHKASLQQIRPPLLVLVQLPKTTDSVDAKSESGSLNKRVGEFVAVLKDIIEGFTKISDSGTIKFSWSIVTKPQGAELWISRLGEKEQKMVRRHELFGSEPRLCDMDVSS